MDLELHIQDSKTFRIDIKPKIESVSISGIQFSAL